MLGLVKFLDRIAHRLGYTPAVQQALSLSSPWSTSDALKDATLASLYGLGDHLPVTRLNALSVGTVDAGRQVIAGTCGRLPLKLSIGGVRQLALPSLLQQPEAGLTRSTSMTWLFDDLLFHPCAWWVVRERDNFRFPSVVERVPHNKARINADGWLTHAGDEPIEPRDVIRFDSPTGEGLLRKANRTIRRAIAIELAAAFAEDNPVPSIVLYDQSDAQLTPEEMTEIVEGWVASRKEYGAAYMSKTLKAETLGQHPEQLLIEGRRALSLDLVRHMSLPAWAASTAVDGATMTYDNRSLRNWELIDLTLQPYLTAVAERLSMPDVTPRGWQIEFDLDALTRPDHKTRFETYKLGLDGGFIDQNYINAHEGEPLKGNAA